MKIVKRDRSQKCHHKLTKAQYLHENCRFSSKLQHRRMCYYYFNKETSLRHAKVETFLTNVDNFHNSKSFTAQYSEQTNYSAIIFPLGFVQKEITISLFLILSSIVFLVIYYVLYPCKKKFNQIRCTFKNWTTF